MKEPLKLNENDSNLVWAAKHWWLEDAAKAGAKDNFEQFWFVIAAVYERVYEYEPNVDGILHFVQETWFHVFSKSPKLQRLFEELQVDTLPSNSWRCSGMRRVGHIFWDKNSTYNDKGLIVARIAKMMSQFHALSTDEIALSPRWTDLEIKNIPLDFLN